MLRHVPVRLAGLAGYAVTPLDSGWLVQRSQGRPLTSRRLDRRSWLVQRGKARSMRRIGPPEARTHLVLDHRAARQEMAMVQRGLSRYLVEEQVAWLLRELDITCVLDVGANVGQYARSLRRCGYRGRIVSFEPVAALAQELEAAAADDPDWVVYDFALGDEETTMEINVAHGLGTLPATVSSLLPSSEFGKGWTPKLRDMGRETIRIRRLDSVFDEAVQGLSTPRVFLKLDTQGYDLKAFNGAGERVHDLLGMQSEVSCVPIYDGMPHMVEQMAAYEKAGFAPAGMFQVSRDRKTMRIIEFDVVMVRDGVTLAGQTQQTTT
jgi:FkbM family methyltransferase